MVDLQLTLSQDAVLEGIGLHTGKRCRALFRPAPANAGIRFFRADLRGTPMVPAKLAFVVDTHRGTTLSVDGAAVNTVEHVLSAATGLGIDNLDIVLDAPEPPAADGSALPIARTLLAAGLREQDSPKRALRLPETVRYKNGATSYSASPSERFEVLCTLEHEAPVALHQSLELAVDPETYLGQIAGARTFAFDHELEYLRAHGLAKGGSLENAIVISKDSIHTTKEGLRFNDEFVRHKILDLIGDLTLLGRSLLKVRIEAHRCGHTHNIQFAKLLNETAAKLRRKTWT